MEWTINKCKQAIHSLNHFLINQLLSSSPLVPEENTDVGARILLPFVEKELGVPLTIVSKPGGGGWVGWTNLVNAKEDGYTIG